MAQPTWIGYKLSGRYEIEQELGSGGMSAVFKASDPNLKRVVAIKLIHPHLSNNPDFIHRFEIEASAVAQLRHPNIVQVYDFNHDGDTYYMVLEFVPGETLQERLKRLNATGRKMTTDQVIDIAAKICDAVDYAHKRGLVHRDIKPANVMINVQGEPILMDFGIVRILGGTQHTATGAVVGTALYMSPEQIRGEHPDHRADIYSLGVMLYEMLSGRPPYEADSAMTIMMMHLNDPVPDVTATTSGLPDGLKLVLERALAKNPAQRFQSAGELAAALRAVRTGGVAAMTRPPAGTVVESARTYVEAPRPAAPAPQATYIEPQQSAARPAQSYAAQTPPPQPPAAQPRPAAASKKPNSRALLFGGVIVVVFLLLCIIGSVAFLPGLLKNLNAGGRPTDQVTSTQEQQAVVVGASETPEPTEAATNTPEPPTATPTDTPTPTITPTPTATQPEGPYVLITDITVVSGAYNVFYETFNFDPLISNNPESHHIHFFWNIYDPITVGVKGVGDSTGGGSWLLYDVPNPFKGYTVGARPGAATQICALVANYDHSINLDSGNCFDLPE